MGISSSVIGLRLMSLSASAREATGAGAALGLGGAATAAALAAALAATAGAAAIDASSVAWGTAIVCPHLLQRPVRPDMRSGTSKRAPQLWQKKTIAIGPSPSMLSALRMIQPQK